IEVLKALRDVGNTVVVVEHEQEMMEAADYIIDIGPEAGAHGGELVFAGTYNELLNQNKSWTGKYLSGRERIEIPVSRRKWTEVVTVKGARENNLKGINVDFPLQVLTAIT